jgi:hypothetical protein
MIVGHLAFAALAKRTFFKTENLPILMFASYGPDFVDKTASFLLGFPGRNFGHSLVFFLTVFAAAWMVCQVFHFRQDVILAAALMWVAHLAGDFVRPTVLFWPFLSPIEGEPFHLAGVLHRMYVELRWPGQLTLEICLVTLALLPLPVLERIGSHSSIQQLRSVFGRKAGLKSLPQRSWTEMERK